MYLPKHFRAPDAAAMHALMRSCPLACVVIHDGAALLANHIPLELDAADGRATTLRGHVARANPLWRELGAGRAALAVFGGADHYVSPGWYPSKQVDGRVVPTWNYRVVHAHGVLRAVEDAEWLRGLVTRLTDRHERDMPRPWQVSDAPEDFVDRMLAAVVGVELVVGRLEGKWKLSQNQPAANRAGVVAGLREQGGAQAGELAAAVREAGG